MLQYNQLKQRNRSRSGSSLASVSGQQRQHPPPLVSHASDPTLATSLSLITPNPPSPSTSTSTLQPLLAQLLTSKYQKYIIAYCLGIEPRVPASLSCECLSFGLPRTSTCEVTVFLPSILTEQIKFPCPVTVISTVQWCFVFLNIFLAKVTHFYQHGPVLK